MPQRERGEAWDRMIREYWFFARFCPSQRIEGISHKALVTWS